MEEEEEDDASFYRNESSDERKRTLQPARNSREELVRRKANHSVAANAFVLRSPPSEGETASGKDDRSATLCAPYELDVMRVIVNLGNDEFRKVIVRQGEQPEEVARRFSRANGVSQRGEAALRSMLAADLLRKERKNNKNYR